MTDISAAAAALLREHDERRRSTSIREAFPFEDIGVAYDIQDEFLRLLRERRSCRTVGYKIGLTSQRMQEMCGILHPLAGQILEDRVFRSASEISLSAHVRLGVECEIAVRLSRDLDADTLPDTILDLGEFVEAVAPAFELIEDRDADYTALDMLSLVADNSWNAGVVLGEFRTSWPDLGEIAGSLTVNEAEIDRGFGRDALGHPFEPLLWLARHLVSRGGRLHAGEIVMTGSLVPTRFPAEGDHYRFALEGLGAVEATFTN